MNIREMVIDDYLQVKGLWNDCGLSEEPEDQKKDIETLLNSPQSTGFVAQKNGTIAGAVLCGSDGRYGYIHHLAVSKILRKKGIGKSLVDRCIMFMQKKHVVIMVRKNNNAGNGFWKNLHFQNADWVNVQFLKTQ